jgi:hypothetical protein
MLSSPQNKNTVRLKIWYNRRKEELASTGSPAVSIQEGGKVLHYSSPTPGIDSPFAKGQSVDDMCDGIRESSLSLSYGISKYDEAERHAICGHK